MREPTAIELMETEDLIAEIMRRHAGSILILNVAHTEGFSAGESQIELRYSKMGPYTMYGMLSWARTRAQVMMETGGSG